MFFIKRIYGNLKSESIIKLSFGFIFLFMQFLTVYTQVPELRLKYFSRAEGVKSSYVRHVCQDSLGFIWIATQDGLCKYDGYNFTTYSFTQKDSTTLFSNNLTYLYIDNKGQLWIGTAVGLCRYNYSLDQFERLYDLFRFSNLIDQGISHICEDKNGQILISSSNYIFRFNDSNKKFSPVLSLTKGKINYFIVDKDNQIWIACSDNQGLQKFNLNTGKWEMVKPMGIDRDKALNISISCLSFQNEKLWMSTMGNGIKMFDTNNKILTDYPISNNDEAIATSVYVDNNDNVWAVDFTGLKILNKQSGTFFGYYPQTGDPKSIKANVKGIFQDKQGNYWIYHEPGGIGMSLILKGFRCFDDNDKNFWHTLNESIISLQEDGEGNLWIGNAQGGINVFDYKTKKIITYLNDEHDKYSLGKGSVMCIFRDRKGIMWVSSYFGGLQCFDKKSRRFIGYKNNPADSASIAGTDIRSIAEDNDGNLWLAIHGKGIDKFDRKHSKFIHFNQAINNLSNDWTFQVFIDCKGDLWVASAWGLNYLKKGESKFNFYYFDQKDTNSLSNSFINTIYEDNKRNLWIGTSSGLNRYNRERNNFIRYENIFENNNIACILSDKDNNLWISSLSGLAMFNYEKKMVKNFSLIDGLVTDEFNARSCFKKGSNELFFGGTKGIVFFKPDRLIYNKLPPFVFIDKIKILDKEIKLFNSTPKGQKQLGQTEGIMLKHTDNVITIGFKALNFINPQMNHYAYRLEGFDKSWNYVQDNREATYTNLDPGNYVFKVIASNNDGVWNYEGAELKIEVIPPWYATVLFRITLLILLTGLIIGYIMIRTSTLKKQKILLEKKVQEKTFELSEKNQLLKAQAENLNDVNQQLIERKNQLEQQSEELKNQSESLHQANIGLKEHNHTKDRFFSLIAHDLTSPFNTILGFSELLVSEFDSLSEDEKLEFVKAIHSSSEKVNALLQSLLLWASSQGNRLSFNPLKINILKIINESVELSDENRKAKGIRIQIDCKEDIHAMADLMMVKTIFRNLLNNAIKFTPINGSIHCMVVKKDHSVEISVLDTGIGLKQEKIEEILSSGSIMPQYGTKGERGSGLGLTLCKDFIKKNNGELKISSEEGKGSTFTFSLPEFID
jgi:signal transduction histidine kinase/ligand-binding sensor domain-containing protein